MAHTVFCVRYKKEMEGLDEPPFDSEFGEKIFKNVSKAAWASGSTGRRCCSTSTGSSHGLSRPAVLGRADGGVLLRRRLRPSSEFVPPEH